MPLSLRLVVLRDSQSPKCAHSFALADGRSAGVHRSREPELSTTESERRVRALGAVGVLFGSPPSRAEQKDGEEEESGTEGTGGVMRRDSFDEDDNSDDDNDDGDDNGVDGDAGESTLFESFLSVSSVCPSPRRTKLSYVVVVAIWTSAFVSLSFCYKRRTR